MAQGDKTRVLRMTSECTPLGVIQNFAATLECLSFERSSLQILQKIEWHPTPFVPVGVPLPFVCKNTTPKALCAPYTRAQAFKLDDLAVVDKDIDL